MLSFTDEYIDVGTGSYPPVPVTEIITQLIQANQCSATDALSHLFVRNTEIIAVIPCPIEGGKVEDGGAERIVKFSPRQQLLVTLNPQR